MNAERPPTVFDRDGEALLLACRREPWTFAPRAAFIDWCQENPELIAAELDRLKTHPHRQYVEAPSGVDVVVLAHCWTWLATYDQPERVTRNHTLTGTHDVRVVEDYVRLLGERMTIDYRVFAAAAASFRCPAEGWGYAMDVASVQRRDAILYGPRLVARFAISRDRHRTPNTGA